MRDLKTWQLLAGFGGGAVLGLILIGLDNTIGPEGKPSESTKVEVPRMVLKMPTLPRQRTADGMIDDTIADALQGRNDLTIGQLQMLNELRSTRRGEGSGGYRPRYALPPTQSYEPALSRDDVRSYGNGMAVDTRPVEIDNRYRYSGSSGRRYQYDLSNPSDELRYDLDLSAQMRDEMNIDPRVDLDRSLGQNGGGVEH